MPEAVSVVMTAYKRAHLLGPTLESVWRQPGDFEVVVVTDGWDEAQRDVFQASIPPGRDKWQYWCNRHRPNVSYSNQSVPLNLGVRAATGDILIIQNAECLHVGNVIEALVTRAVSNPLLVQFAQCKAYQEGADLNSDTGWVSYCHSVHRRRPLFFCGAMHKSLWDRLGGMDEDYPYYGSEDTDFADRLLAAGAEFCWRDDVVVKHQWHPRSDTPDNWKDNQQLYLLKRYMRESGLTDKVRWQRIATG